MVKRMILMLAVMALVIAGLGFVKFRQIQAATQMVFQPPPEAVTTVHANRANWPSTVSVIGTLQAVQGVTVSADLPGIVSRIGFESGKSVRKGDVLVELDTKQEQAQLAAQEAQRELAGLNFGRMKGLVEQGAVTRAEYDEATAAQREADARIAEIRATIERKTIRAPFSGVLGIRKVNLGQYLSAGDPVVSLQSWDPIYVNFGVPQQEAAQVRAAGKVKVTTDALPGKTFAGTVTAIDSIVDESTRNVQLQATLPNPGGKLRPGLFVEVEAMEGAARSVISLPASAISYAPYGDSVYVVSDLKDPKGQSYRGVRQQFVKVEGGRGDQVAVISGINPGDEIVTSGVFKLRNGSAVQVNNQVQPANSLAPNPEDN
jgi:membrane fusion protein (multidrug efflux system)